MRSPQVQFNGADKLLGRHDVRKQFPSSYHKQRHLEFAGCYWRADVCSHDLPWTIVDSLSSTSFAASTTAKASGSESFIIPEVSVATNLYLNYSTDFTSSFQMSGSISLYAIPILSDFIQS